jgi:hypothetical protein
MLEKRDLQVRLLESGRVIIACTNDDTPANADPASSTSSSSSTGSANSNGNPSNNNNNSNSSSSAGIGGSNNSSSSSAAGRSDDEIICLPIHYSESAFNSLGLQDLRALYRKLCGRAALLFSSSVKLIQLTILLKSISLPARNLKTVISLGQLIHTGNFSCQEPTA